MLIDAPTSPPRLIPADPPKTTLERRWWQRKATDAQVLRRAVDIIDERGWTTGEWIDRNGRVCLLGAIGVAGIEAGRRAPGYVTFQHKVMHVADRLVGHGLATRLSFANDCARDKGQIKDRLRKMAAQAETNGGKYPRA